MPFNYERFISNINNIITMKGFKVGDIEKKAGVSVGYISKLSSRNTEGGPSTAVTFNIAKALGVSVELLVEGNYCELDPNLETVIKFVDKLVLDTDSKKIVWDAYSISKINELLDDDDIDVPFIKRITSPRRSVFDGLNDEFISKRIGKSNKVVSFDNSDLYVYCHGPSFCVQLSDDSRVWIVRLMYENSNNEKMDIYEMYLGKYKVDVEVVPYVDRIEDSLYWDDIPLCSTYSKASIIENNIASLYDTLVRNDNDLKMDGEVKDTILAYLNGAMENRE